MKQLLLFLFCFSLFSGIMAQQRATVSHDLKNVSVIREMNRTIDGSEVTTWEFIPYKSPNLYQEDEIGETYYDKQSNRCTANRVYLHSDGTMAATWTFSLETSGFNDRGSGYNYFDGNDWGSWPTSRIEIQKGGWPSYAPLGENGEIVVSHNAVDALLINRRPDKGEGSWTQSLLQGPPGFLKITWPRVITTGIDHSVVHILGIIRDMPASGDFTLGYYRSPDGGDNWDILHEEIEGTGHDYYNDIGADSYVFAEPKNGVIAFAVFNMWCDMFLMKSMDDGDTWSKTIVWGHPYPFFDDNTIFTDTLWAPDNSGAICLDNNGMAHLTFGIAFMAHFEAGSSYTYWPGLSNGIGYWNENMAPFTAPDPHDALDPLDVLIEDVNLIGWSQDLNGDGELNFTDDIIAYSEIGLCTMSTLVVDESNHVFVAYAATTEGFDNGVYNYKRIWARTSPDGGLSWGTHYNLTEALQHLFDECVYPQFTINTDGNLYLMFNVDAEPGNAVDGDHGYIQNREVFMTINKDEILGFGDQVNALGMQVSQNYPNPFTGSTVIDVTLIRPETLYLEVSDLTGRIVYRTRPVLGVSGSNLLTLDASRLEKGVYIYTIHAGQQRVNKKMTVE